MRERDTSSVTNWQIDDLLFQPGIRRLSRRGREIRLPSLSFEVLRVLVEYAPEPVSIQAFIDSVWQGVLVSDETVTQRIKLLRQSLGDDGRRPRYIQAVRGRGYRLMPPPVAGKESTSQSRIWLAGAGVVFVLLGVAGTYFYRQDQPIEQLSNIHGSTTVQDYIDQASEYLDRHQQADNQLAIDLFRRALALQPENQKAMAGLSMALSQSVTKFNAEPSLLIEAQKLAQQVISAEPHQYPGWLALAASLDGQGALIPAIQTYQKVLEIAPEHNGAKASLAYLHLINGELVTSLKLNLEVFNSEEEFHYLHLQIAQALYLLGFDPAAEPWLQRTDELQPDNVFAAEARARFLLVNRRFDDAEQVLSNAIQRGVRRAELWLEMGMIELLRDDLPAAQRSFDQALRIEPQNGQAQAWQLSLAALTGELQQSMYQQNLNEMQATIKAGDTWPNSYLQMASLQAAYGDHDAALETIQQLYSAGFRDHRLLNLWPTFTPLLTEPRFQNELVRIQQEVVRQRDAVLRAAWVPRELLFAQPVPDR